MYRTQNAAESDSNSASSDEDETNWKRSTGLQSAGNASLTQLGQQQKGVPVQGGGSVARPRGPRRRNDVWGDVIQEQVLMEQMGSGFAVEALPVDGEDRGVESYDFTRARLDPRPQIEPVPLEGIPESLARIRKEEEKERARKVRERLGVPEGLEMISPTADIDEVTESICKRLKEPKIGLIQRVVNTLGSKKALELLYATENIEANGGLMINNGTRRRTPGGVYLHLLRSNKQISHDDMDNIFSSERAEAKDVQRKRKHSEVEKKAFRTIRRLEEAILGERPSSSSSSSDEGHGELGVKRTKSESAMGDDFMKNIQRPCDLEMGAGRTSDLEEGEIDD